MKTTNMIHSIGAIALVGVLMSPTLSFAVEPVYDAQVESAVNNGLNNANSKLDQVNSSVNSVQLSASDILKFMSNSSDGSPYSSMDQISAKYVQALINYDAAARLNEYQYNQELLFMKAPGSESAVKAGALVGSSNVSASALKFSNLSFIAAVSPFSKSKNFTGTLTGGSAAIQATPIDKVKLYDDNFASFVSEGNTSGLTVVNPAQFIQSTNLVKSNLDTQSQQMISLLTRPPSVADPVLLQQIAASGGPEGGGKELIVDSLSEYAIISLSMNALGDIVARRTPGTDSNNNQLTQSVMEVMDQYSGERFTNKDWYTKLSTASDTALLREIAHIQAYNAWVQFQQFKVQEQQMALLSTMNVVLAKMNIGMSRLDAQIQSAQAQASKAASDYQNAASKCKAGQILDATGSCIDYSPPETPSQ